MHTTNWNFLDDLLRVWLGWTHTWMRPKPTQKDRFKVLQNYPALKEKILSKFQGSVEMNENPLNMSKLYLYLNNLILETLILIHQELNIISLWWWPMRIIYKLWKPNECNRKAPNILYYYVTYLFKMNILYIL